MEEAATKEQYFTLRRGICPDLPPAGFTKAIENKNAPGINGVERVSLR